MKRKRHRENKQDAITASKPARTPSRTSSRRKDPSGLSGRPQARPASARTASRRKWVLLALVVVLAFAGTWALLELVVWARVPSDLVGKWVVTDGPDVGGTVDFYRNGTMVAKVNNGGYEGIIEARIRVEGNTIHVTTRHRQTGEEGTRVQTIKALDANRLVLEDERGMSVSLERAN
jgi:uncharacterized protein (TIGR03066 family)